MERLSDLTIRPPLPRGHEFAIFIKALATAKNGFEQSEIADRLQATAPSASACKPMLIFRQDGNGMTREEIAAVADKVSRALDDRVRQLVAFQLADHRREAANGIALLGQRIDELEVHLRELKAPKGR